VVKIESEALKHHSEKMRKAKRMASLKKKYLENKALRM